MTPRPAARLARAAALAAGLALAGPDAAGGVGSSIAVDGQILYLERLGATGPLVVFEAGLGEDLSTWRRVAGPVADFARVALYDRAGLGRSRPMTREGPVTAAETVARLRALLAAAGLPPPYVLVGHSLGGLYVQAFARLHPDETAGVVLLDAASPEAPEALRTLARLEPGSAAWLEAEGVAESNRQTRAAGPFPDRPLAVVAATDHGPHFADWEPTLLRLQRDLAALSPQGVLIVAEGAGHDVHLERPDLVVAAIRGVVDAVAAAPAP